MRLKLLSVFIFLMLFSSVKAQIITVINSVNDEPIPGVIVSDTAKSNYRVSNSKGQLSIATFDKYNLLLIQHNYYQKIIISKDSLASLNYIVSLDEITFEMDGFTVFANKWEQNKRELPFSISEVRPKDVSFQNPQSTPDMLANTGKVFVQKSQMGGGSPMIRGFAANSVLLVVDGVRMNNAIFRGGNLQNSLNIDANSLGHTEVIFGPGSVTYGSDALGGVMDFHTKEAEFCTEGKFDSNVDGFVRGSSANSELTMGVSVDLKFKKFSSHTQILKSEFSDLKAGKNHFGNYPDFGKRDYVAGVQTNGRDTMIKTSDESLLMPTSFSLSNINQKFRYQPNKNLDITYSFIYSTTTDIPRYDRLTQYSNGYLKYAEWYYGPQSWTMHNLKIRLFKVNKYYDSGQLIFAFQNFQESRHDRKFGSVDFRHRSENVDLYTTNINFSKSFSESTVLYYGAEVAVNDVRSFGYSQNINTNVISQVQTRYPNESNLYSSAGIYANLKHKITDKLSLLLGLRYSIISLQSKFDTLTNSLPFNDISLVNQSPNGSLGLAYMLADDMQINANLATGFRAPNLDDVAKVFDSEPGSVVVPNEELKPEYVYSAELSFIKSFKKIAQLELTAYTSYVDNVILRRDYTYNGQDSIIYDGTMSKVQAMQNGDNAIIYGGVIGFRLNFSKQVNARATYNITRGHAANGDALPHVTPDFGSLSVNYENKYFKLSAYSNYSGGIAFDDLAPSEQAKTYMYTPDGSQEWFTLNFRTEIKLYKNLSMNLAVENILDRFYQPYASGVPAAGRNFTVGLRLYPF